MRLNRGSPKRDLQRLGLMLLSLLLQAVVFHVPIAKAGTEGPSHVARLHQPVESAPPGHPIDASGSSVEIQPLVVHGGKAAPQGLGVGLYKAALLMNAETKDVLFQTRPHRPLLPASLTKMMLSLLALEKLYAGEVFLHDQVVVSERASRVGGSRIFLKAGEIISFKDLMKAVLIRSANDAAVAVAEHIGQDMEGFIKLMNVRARELGMKETVFHNVHGLPCRGKDNISSAHDMAILASRLLKYPLVLQWTSLQRAKIRGGSYLIRSTNKLLGHFPGMDGLKTGFFRRAGFNMAATAKRGRLRLIAVVMGSPSSVARFQAAKTLLSIGFRHYQKLRDPNAVATLN